MVTGAVIASPVDGKGEVRLRGKKVGLKSQTSAQERLISPSPTPHRPDVRLRQEIYTKGKRGRKIHNRTGSFNKALKRTASHRLVIEWLSI
jgi:hypothetical protein